jgi:hypothetical protein
LNTIIKGTTVTYDYTIAGVDGEPFSLAGCSVDFVATSESDATTIDHELVVNIFGVATTSVGMALGSGDGMIVQTLSAAVTTGMAEGRWTWKVTLTDSTGAVTVPLRGSWVVAAEERAVVRYPAQGYSRGQLRRRIAQNLGDYRLLTCTAASSGSVITDSLQISTATEDLSGCQIVVTTGLNVGHIARIQSVNDTLNQATIVPAAPYNFAVDDTIDVVMRRGRGWEVREYHQAINDAIDDAYPITLAEMMAEYVEFNVETGKIVVPPEMSQVYAVEWEDANGNWHTLPKAQRTNGWGWKADVSNGVIVVTDSPRYLADGQPVRLYGYGKHPTMSAESDRTDINAEWLAARASYYLVRAGMDRDPQRGSLILLFERESTALRPRLRTLRKGATTNVRPT